MLGKLIKHEFRATGRVMIPVLLILLLTAVGGNISLRIMDATDNQILLFVAGLIIAAFFIALMAVGVVALVLMINRFRTNLLGDEGYVMFTLPTSVHEQVWSKMLVSTVWFIATGIAMILAFLILIFRVQYVSEAFSGIQGLLDQLNAYYALNGVAILLEMLVLIIVGCLANCLLAYAALAVGHSFVNHKMLLSILFFFVFLIAIQILGTLGLFGAVGMLSWINWDQMDGMVASHALLGSGIVVTVLYGAIFYVITTFMLKRHLNLE